MIATVPYFAQRGTPISVYHRLKALSHLGHEVDLLTYPVGQDIPMPGVTIRRTAGIPGIRRIAIGPSKRKLLFDWLVFVKAARLLATRQYDVVHTHEEAAYFGGWLGRLFGVPHLYDMHSSLPRQLTGFGFRKGGLPVRIFKWLERRTITRCDALITIDPELDAYARRIAPAVNGMMIENIPIAYDDLPDGRILPETLLAQHNISGRKLVIYTGNFIPYQGVDLMLESAIAVAKAHPDVCFVLVGGKRQEVAAKRRWAAQNGLQDHVVFTGTVGLAEALAWTEAADILVSPRIEGTSVPLKIYSYMQAGKPIIATQLRAHTLVLDESNALLVAVDEAEMAAGIGRLLADSALRQRLGAAAHWTAEVKYNFELYASKVGRLYQSIPIQNETQKV